MNALPIARRTLLLAAAATPLVARTGFAATPGPVSPLAPGYGPARLSVRPQGGKTGDTAALQRALDRCTLLGGGEVRVTAGDYLIGAIEMGPRTLLRLDEGATLTGSPDVADYPLRQVRWEGRFVTGHVGLIHAERADDIGIAGKGRIVGNPAIRERIDRRTGYRNPALIEFTGCDRVDVSGVFTQQNAMWSIHPLFCNDVRFADMVVNGGADGIDVDSCARVLIERCTFDTSDDCIALKSGRGEEAWRLGHPTTDVHVRDCTFSDDVWGCMSIGSETSAGIRGVLVERCRFLQAGTHAVYIKSRPGRGAFIEDIVMRDLDVAGPKNGFLRLNFANSGKQDPFPVQGRDGIPTVARFRFDRIRVRDVPMLVDGTANNPAKPLDGFALNDVTGTCAKGIALAHVRHASLRNIAVSGYSGPLLATLDVSGRGLEGAVPLSAPPPAPEPVPVPAVPYRVE